MLCFSYRAAGFRFSHLFTVKIMQRTHSQEIISRARQLMPGGVNSPARAFGAVGGDPVVFTHGSGPYLFDVDGNRYIDYVLSWGPMILGHGHSEVTSAIQAAVQRGTSFGAPTQAENDLAELIIEAVPSVEKVRLVNSGTEATMSAIRLARGYTKRDVIIKFAGNYHGHVDSLLVAAGSSAATLAVPDSPGVTAGTSQDTVILPYNDISAAKEAFQQHGDRIAGVILEPVVGNMGCVPASQEFLAALRELTEHYGALLIFDEVMSGFRVAYGGAQQLRGIIPDLTTLGKIVGGGMPIGAYGGKSEIMDQMLPNGKVFQAGTLSGNPIATAAGIATLKILRDETIYVELERKAADLAAGLQSAIGDADAHVARVGSMLTLFFHSQPVSHWENAAQCDTDRFARFFWGMLDRGIYLPCSQFEAVFLSTCHQEEDIRQTVDAAREVFAEI